MPLPPFVRQMGAGNTSLHNQKTPHQLLLGKAIASKGNSLGIGATPVRQQYHKTPRNSKQKNNSAAIPGGAYLISPLAVVSVWAALKLQFIEWRHLCVWIALLEVRTWRDTLEPKQRKLFRFTAKRVAQVLGNKRAGPRLLQALADLERLGLARLSPTRISFTASLDGLPPGLRGETENMIRSLGNDNTTRPIQMPRRLMRLIMKSRARPLRAAVIFAMLLRIMHVKRFGWYKGCVSTSLLTKLSGFSESRLKRERAALVREGCFERQGTPGRVRQKHGDWYSLGQDLPEPLGGKKPAKWRPPTAPSQRKWRPPIKKPVSSFGMETNQLLSQKPGASLSASIQEQTEMPSWSRIVPEDLREAPRRSALYQDACQKGVIGGSQAERLTFYSAMARARRLGSVNPCGMLRRIVEMNACHGFISQRDEDQARTWLRELEPQPAQEVLALVMPQPAPDSVPGDVEVYRILTHGLMRNGYDPSGEEAYDIVRRNDKMNVLRGWTSERWQAARAEALGHC